MPSAMAREPNRSTDEESTPLLDHPNEDHVSLLDRFSTLTQEPLTPLTRLLLVAVLVLLVLSSAFIGLFVGVEHRLSSHVPGPNPDNGKTSTATTTTISTTSVVITAQPPEPTPDPTEQPCLDSHCVVVAASILNSLDTSQDPCENFYEFANGGWLKENPIPSDMGNYGTFEEAALQNQRIIQGILAGNSTLVPSPDSQTLVKLQDMYHSCLDVDHLDKLGIKPLKDIASTVKNLFRGISTNVEISKSSAQDVLSTRSTQGLTATVAYLHSRGINGLFLFDLEGDVGVDPDEMTLWFYQPELGLPSKEYFEEEPIREKYISIITRIFLALDGEEEPADSGHSRKFKFWPPFPWPPWDGNDDKDKPKPKKTARELATSVVHFERDLARASLDLDLLEQDPVGTYNPTSFADLSASIPEIDFPAYWSTFAPRAFPERIIVTYPSFLTSLSTLLSNTTDDVLEGYLVARASLSLAEYLGTGTEVWKANQELIEELTGASKGAGEYRAKYCLRQVEKTLGFAAGRFFVQQAFSEGSQSRATRIIQDIVKAFKGSLSNLDWMDHVSAEAAADKASAIRIKVGFPLSPNTSDAVAIANYYSRVSIDKYDFLGNSLKARVLTATLNWAKLGKRRDKLSWGMVPSEVNAYFNPPANEIVFPAGILRPPFFSRRWPGYLTYGAFGHVAAHELTHAFDSAGRLYNREGKLLEWWTNATSQAFEERRLCISRQYSSYTVDDGKGGRLHVNGNLTSGENIGDQGLIQAYRAWKAQYDESFHNGIEYILPGLNFTRDQLFFISFGRAFAQNITPQEAVRRVRADPHSPTRYRVMGTLVNIPQFAEAFNCPRGSKLNPPEEERCKLW